MNSLRRDVAEGFLGAEGDAGKGILAAFSFPAGLEVFGGHFPGHPVLPGVFQIEMVRTAAERALGDKLLIAAVEEAKFLREIKPGEPIRVAITISEEGDHLRAKAKVFVAEERAGELRIVLRRQT